MQKLLVLASILWLAACASYTEETEKVRQHFSNGRYQEALASLEESGLKDEGRSSLLYHTEKAMILDRLGDKEKARKLLLEADQIVDRLYTLSVSKTAASFIVNDRAQDYEGEVFEKIAIHTMLALSYLEEGRLDAARVSARKINSKLYEITQSYGDEHNSYREDAFARYLAGLIYEARGEWDDALIDYKKALELYRSSAYQAFYQGPISESLIEALYRLAEKRQRPELLSQLKKEHGGLLTKFDSSLKAMPEFGEVAVIHELGRITTKSAKEFIFPFGKQIIRFSFPYIRRKSHFPPGPSGIQTKDGHFIAATNVADMNAIAYHCLEDRRGRLLLKGAARLLAKGQITEQAYQNFGLLGGLAANAYTAVTETADTRSWTLLPEAFYISRLKLPPGKHTLGIKNGGSWQDWVTIDIRAGQLVLLRAYEGQGLTSSPLAGSKGA